MPDRDREILEIYVKLMKPKTPNTKSEELGSSLDLYDELISTSRGIFESKNRIYGDAFRETGIYGTFAVLAGDIARLRKMIYQEVEDRDYNLGEIADKLYDVINQAVITLMMIIEDNWTGENQE